jgi:signal transduction histidine kinase
MEGFEKDWNHTDASRRYVTYTNLDPGDYTFRVKASNNDGVWNEKGTSLKIVILPPFWKTWWFKTIILTVIIIIVISIFRLRIRRLREQKILLERSVAEKTAELHELNASKDKFFSIIAHDLKNPFNTIIGFSEMMKESIKLNDSATFYEYTVMINNSAVQTLRLLENLLEWANSQSGKLTFIPVPIVLNDLVKEEFVMAEDMATRKKIELKSYIPDDLTVVADKNMIRTILRNLITNAIKFTYINGQVQVNTVTRNNQVEISVSDTGIGMSEETMTKLFRIDASLSIRGTDNEKGTGLGLFLCKEFVEKHRGKIWVESEEGKGSTFKFLLPLYLDEPGRTV